MTQKVLQYSSDPDILADFASCIKLIDRVFGEEARTLSLQGHELEARFRLLEFKVRGINLTAEGSSYKYKWTPEHRWLCEKLSDALVEQLMKGSLHDLGFKMAAYGVWSVGRARSKKLEAYDKFGVQVRHARQTRRDWFAGFIGQEDVFELNLSYPAMARPFGPMWPSLRFDYMIGRADTHLWLMSHGLSNPNHPSQETDAHPDWETSNGVGCEVLVRCDPARLDLTGGIMAIMSSPEMVILDSLCGTLVNMWESEEKARRIDSVKATQIIGLEYYKDTPIRPLAEGTKFALTNASSFDISRKIPCSGPYYARPLIATCVTDDLSAPDPDDISRALIKAQTIGLLPPFNTQNDIGL